MEVKGRRAVVYFSYEAQDEDELTISPGQVHSAIIRCNVIAEECVRMIVYYDCFCRLSMCLTREKKGG